VDESTKTNNYCMIADVAEWTAGSIKIIYDRTTCLVHKISPSGDLTGSAPFGPNTTPLPATTSIDYVRLWS
jgi:hypothetical protein